MIIFPAVDIKEGRAVRLRQGSKEHVTVFGDDPVAMTWKWQRAGARWLHIVDLDGAFDGSRKNASIIGRICAEVGIPVQVGGGIRTLEDASHYMKAGVSRLIIGTTALENPDVFQRMLEAHPGRIGVSLDAIDGRLKTRGWERDANLRIEDIAPAMRDAGAAFIIYTDINRDGMHSGINLAALERLLQLVQMPVIAAGGVSTLDDVRRAHELALKYPHLEGVVSGRALYDGSLDLAEGMAWLATHGSPRP